MGLITKEVEMTWRTNNSKRYINKGYKFTQYGDMFLVKVEDLSLQSNKTVEVICDNCNILLKNVPYDRYNKCLKNNKYYCNKCATKLFAIEKIRKARLSNGISFKDWCLSNRKDLLERWDYELNSCDPQDISYSSHAKCYFKCPRDLHESNKFSINSITRQNSKLICPCCNSFAQWGIDNLGNDFLENYWDYEKNVNINPWEISYGSPKQKVYIKCQTVYYHNSYEVTCNSFVAGNRCPYCHGMKVHPLDSLGKIYPNVFDIWSDKNNKTPYDYPPYGHDLVWWKCENNVHEEYQRRIQAEVNFGFRCPQCVRERNESFLQEKVRLYFESLGFFILHEKDCNLKCYNPQTNFLLPYDNEIVELKLLCETHGIQHYKITNFHKLAAKNFNTTSEYQLEYLKYKDQIKKEFALLNGYYFLEIPYWTEKDESYKQLIDDKINSILSQEATEKVASFIL
jgi:hypothetical protein